MKVVKCKALDTIHISNVSADNLFEGDEFELGEQEAKRLEDRGLVKISGVAKEKAEPELENKMDPVHMANKTAAEPVAQAPLSADSVPASRKAKGK